jgi:hypothetical protein
MSRCLAPASTRLPASHQPLADQDLDRYVDKAGYFKSVSEYPTAGRTGRGAEVRHDLAQGPSRAAPWLFPGALTLTLWIWVNGPIYVDSFDLAGDLVIVDREGVELARAKDQITFKHNVGLYGGDYLGTDHHGRQAASLLVGELLDTATVQLAKR